MQKQMYIRRLLSAVLAVSLMPVLPVSAQELPQTTLPAQAFAEETTVPETTETSVPEPTETTFVILPAKTELPIPEEEETAFSCPYTLYFGLLHAHTDLSDGLGSVEEAFSHAVQVDGLNFFAVTDHSNSLDSTDWGAGKAAAGAVTTDDFLGIFGYEMTWQETKRIGHIATFGTEGFLSREQEEFSNPATALENYYQALDSLPGSVSMFCHPGEHFGDFDGFGHYSHKYDEKIHLLEVASGQETPSWDQYTKALDAGWHLAPSANQNNHNGLWGDASGLRTVVLADTLTEQSLFSAIRAYRVYATEDPDLHICYELDGHIMGSTLSRADSPQITLSVYDPTDAAIGTVEVVTEGGRVLAAQFLEGNDEFLSIRVSGGFRYYYLRLTQPDGDRAVTAPVWVEGYENMGISGFSVDTDAPVQEQPVTLTLSLFNHEAVDFPLDSVEFFIGNQSIHIITEPGTVSAGETLTLAFTYSHPNSGTETIRAVVRGSVRGKNRSYETSLSLRFRSGVTVTGLLVDGGHQNAGLDALDRLWALTEEAGMDLTLVTGDLPQGGELLLIPEPQTGFEEGFLPDLKRFAENGGDLILWGEPEILHPLLEAIGITMRLSEQNVDSGSAEVFNTLSSWCSGLARGQYFSHPECNSIEVNEGLWLVREGADGPVLLACERTSWGGTVFLAGFPFLQDGDMPEGRSIWELPRANETVLRAILGSKQQVLAQRNIADVRKGAAGTTYRIKGYVTAGTSNPHTTFPDTIYLQDDTGGIAVTGFCAEGIQIGVPLEIIGTLGTDGRNPVLEYTDHQILQESYYRWVPRTMGCEDATDYGTYGGRLVQVEGRVTELTLTADKNRIRRMAVTDIRGDTAIIEIEDGIFSGATGENRLAEDIRKGRTARAMGLLHINEAGEAVIRVRNCDEVVYVPPTVDFSNPATGDRAWFWP